MNNEELKYDYVSYAGIGKRDSKHDDILDDIIKQEKETPDDQDESEVKQLREYADDEEENLSTKVQKEVAWAHSDASKIASVAPILNDAAESKVPHHEILNSLKHTPNFGELDDHLHDYLSKTPIITPEVHHHVFETLAKKNKEAGAGEYGVSTAVNLGHKYGWVMRHGLADEPHHSHLEDYTLTHDDIKRAGGLGLQFKTGRHVKIPELGLSAFMNRDGKFEATGHYTHTDVEIPELNSDKKSLDKTASDLSTAYEQHIVNHKHISHIRAYTEDSVGINKSAASINTGREEEGYVGNFYDHKVSAIGEVIASSPKLPNDIAVHTGISRSVDPAKSSSADGKKTTYLPAFTSTSIDPRQAIEFARGKRDSDKEYGTHPNQPIKDVLSIKVPKGTNHGIYVDDVSENHGEKEFILNHGAVIKHDAEPVITSKHGSLYRIWKNGEIIGHKQSAEWNEKPKIDSGEEAEKQYFGSLRQSVKEKALKSGHATDKILDDAINGKSPRLTSVATEAPNLQPKHIDSIIHSRNTSSFITSNALMHANHTESNLDNALKYSLAGPIASSIAASPHIKERHADAIIKNHISRTAVDVLLNNPATPRSSLEKIANQKDSERHASAAKSKLGITEAEIQKYLSKAREILKG